MSEVAWLLGLPFDLVTTEEAIARIRGAASAHTQLVFATPNVNFLVLATRSPEFRKYVLDSDLVLVDGMPLVWLGRLLGIPVPERVAGSTVVERMMASRSGSLKMFFMGGEDGAARAAASALNTAGGGLVACGHLCPGFGSVESMSGDEVLAEINQSKADFLSVSLGASKGLEWIARNRSRIDVPVICHLGAVVNFLAGRVKRAPRWTQRLGLEWLWRIYEEPGLAKRYASDGLSMLRITAVSVPPLLWRNIYVSLGRADSALGITVIDSGNSVTLRLAGQLDWTTLPKLKVALGAITAGSSVKLDIDGLTWVDARALGYLYSLRFRCHDRRVYLRCEGKGAKRLLGWHRAACLLD